MIRYFVLVSLFLISQNLSGLSLDVNSYAFYGERSYVEVYFRIDGQSIVYIDKLSEKIAEIEILMLFKKGENILHFDKFMLVGSANDSLSDFMDVKRFHADAGEYTLFVQAQDLGNQENKIEVEQKITIFRSEDKLYLSGIQLLSTVKKDAPPSALVKNGIYMEPLAFGFATEKNEVLYFYCEVYNGHLKATEEFYLHYTLAEIKKDKNTHTTTFSKYIKLKNEPIEAIFLPFSLKAITSGSYNLKISVVRKDRSVIFSKSQSFVNANPTADLAMLENFNEDVANSFVQKIPEEELDYILKAHVPVAEQPQMATLGEIIKSKRPTSQRQYIFQYWKRTVTDNFEASFKQYMEVAKAVDKEFYSTVGYGFQTDRGYIFLKYGKPDNVLTIDNEPDAPPYEIWYYNYIAYTQQTNVRFLFYNPSLVHNDFRLLHSTCYSERNFPAWEVELYKSVPMERQGNFIDAQRVGENFNRHARRYFMDY